MIDRMPDGTPVPPHYASRAFLFVLTAVTTLAGAGLYVRSLAANGLNPAEWLLLPLFAALFGWIAFSFWTATVGLGLLLRQHARGDKPAERSQRPLTSRTAVLMPVYNESPDSVFAGLRAMLASLADTGQSRKFDFYVLSDTTDPDVWLREEAAWDALVAERRAEESRVFYRHRPKNVSRKAGNIADFCTRWGAHYEFMIVLDADSLMEGETLVEMTRRMEASPKLGILQVPPTSVNRVSLFARLQQFAAQVYGPVYIRGFAAWAHLHSNYWGHNAIIRIAPFMQHCALPMLPGKPPLGGEILSHDFVEAALITRAGYEVALAEDLGGSYEECPSTPLDFAKRDQRWCQGNLQHLRLIFSEGFHPISRLHLAMGVMSYLASPLWLLFVILSAIAWGLDEGAATSTGAGLSGPAVVFILTMSLLLLPKVWGVIAMGTRPRQLALCGGWSRVIAGALLETILSTLIAPIMMLFHTRFVVTTLLGETVQWNCQNRGDGNTSFLEACSAYRRHMLWGVAALLWVTWLTPALAVWMSPLLAGWMLSCPIAMLLGSVSLGERLARARLLLIREETTVPAVLQMQREALARRESDPRQACLDLDPFGSVLTNPHRYALHRRILRATEGVAPLSMDRLREIIRVVERTGPAGLDRDTRRSLLSDPVALREAHIRMRSREPAGVSRPLGSTPLSSGSSSL